MGTDGIVELEKTFRVDNISIERLVVTRRRDDDELDGSLLLFSSFFLSLSQSVCFRDMYLLVICFLKRSGGNGLQILDILQLLPESSAQDRAEDGLSHSSICAIDL